MKAWTAIGLSLATMLLFEGCGVALQTVSEEKALEAAKDKTKATIVFMRPSALPLASAAVRTSLFHLTEGRSDMVGVLGSSTKIALSVEPGTHQFMAVGETAYFVEAQMEAGKTYYVVVTTHMGWNKCQFRLKPVTKTEALSEAHRKRIASMKWVADTDLNHKWAEENRPNIEEKRMECWQAHWLAVPEGERAILRREDGI